MKVPSKNPLSARAVRSHTPFGKSASAFCSNGTTSRTAPVLTWLSGKADRGIPLISMPALPCKHGICQPELAGFGGSCAPAVTFPRIVSINSPPTRPNGAMK